MVVLSHFKGHAMGGFGGALKNMSIGIASSNGKANIHTAGVTTDPKKLRKFSGKLYNRDSRWDSCHDYESYGSYVVPDLPQSEAFYSFRVWNPPDL